MRIVYSAGVFDLMHAAHVYLLERSRALGDLLIVGVITDAGATAYKPAPPVYNENQRLRIISSLKCVDAAFLQPGTDPTPVLEALYGMGMTPAAMTHGSDWSRLKQGNETLERLGIEFVTIPCIDVRHTSETISFIRAVS